MFTKKKIEEDSPRESSFVFYIQCFFIFHRDRGPVNVLSKGVMSYVGTGGALGTINVCSPPPIPKFTLPSSKGIPPTLTLTTNSINANVSTPADSKRKKEAKKQ